MSRCRERPRVWQFSKKATLEEQKQRDLISCVTDMEIKQAILDIGDEKAPRPDGYTSPSSRIIGMWWDKILSKP